MKQNHLKKVLAVFVAVSMMLLVFNPAVLAEGKDKEKGTGWRPATTAELKQYKDEVKSTKYVLPNKLAIERINKARQQNGETLLPDSLAVPQGQEYVVGNDKPTKAQNKVLGSIGKVWGATLPKEVDNSTSDAFPAIGDQGKHGSCSAFAATYYMATYEMARAQGLNAKTDINNVLSPKFTYNLVNLGSDTYGTSIEANLSAIMGHGALSMSPSEFPYDSSDTGNMTQWPTDPALWRKALTRRTINNYFYVEGLDGIAGPSILKQYLNDGNVLVFATNIEHWVPSATKDDPAVTDDHPDEYAAASMNSVEKNAADGHAMTVVGYNDDIWVDIDGDNQIDSNEKGALKIANSWGTGWTGGNDGFIWIAYDALKNKGTTHPSIMNNLIDDEYYNAQAIYVTADNKPYAPKLTAEINLTTANRLQLSLYSAVTHNEVNEPMTSGGYPFPELNWYEQNYLVNLDSIFADVNARMAKDAGVPVHDYALDGTEGSSMGTIVEDLTGYIPYNYNYDGEEPTPIPIGGALSTCIGIYDNPDTGSIQINSIKFKDEATGDEFYPVNFNYNSADPFTSDDTLKWFSGKHTINPDAVFTPYNTDYLKLDAIQTGHPSTITYTDDYYKMWKFTPAVTGEYNISYTLDPERVDVYFENQAGEVLLSPNDPAGGNNITTTLYGGKTYIIDTYDWWDDPESGDGGDDGEDFAMAPTSAHLSNHPTGANHTYGTDDETSFSVEITQNSTAPSTTASADLTGLTTSVGTLNPGFTTGTADYTVELYAGQVGSTITATPEDTDAYITMADVAGTSKAYMLKPGPTKVAQVEVTAKDWSKTKSYLVNLHGNSPNANLSNITLTNGTISPSTRISYTIM